MSAPVIAQRIPPEQAIAFLARDPVGSIELLCAIRYDRDIQCIGTVRDGTLAGVLVVTREDDDAPAARFEAMDAAALLPLIAACPPDVQRIAVHRPWILPALAAAFRLMPGQTETVFFSTAVNRPPSLPAVRPLTLADAPLMDRGATMMGGRGLRDGLAQGYRPFGVIMGHRVVAHAVAANGTDWTEEVMSVWTAPRQRGQGLATAVVAATAADILSRGKTALYVAAVTNRASQRVAVNVGFQPAYDITTYYVVQR
ncbi:MAG: GNAT family N-acetyltransferase [Thermomicrobia bacterium]|nr:GNAT family N-acetyltransferase [Thermomicrobia bacterium]